MKSKQMMLIKIFMKIKNCLILVMIHKTQRILILSKKLVIGKMKDEFKGKIISELVGLKMYSLIAVDGEKVKKPKRVNKNIIKSMRNEEYINILFNKKMKRHKMKITKSKLHRIGTYNVCEISFSCFDYKRYILDDGINNLAYFHKI